MERSYRPLKPTQREQQQQQQPKQCPRCESTNTKFCYFNNYSQSQPRYFCRACRRYWTEGGTLRNVPQGGGSYRRAKRPKLQGTVSPTTASAPPLPVLNTEFLQAPLMSTATDFGLGTMMLHNMRLPPPPPPPSQPLFDPNFMIVQQHHHQHMNFAVFTTGATSSSPAVGAASSFWNIDGGEGSSSHPAPPDDLNL